MNFPLREVLLAVILKNICTFVLLLFKDNFYGNIIAKTRTR